MKLVRMLPLLPLLAAFCLSSVATQAQILGAVYPAPGGTTFSSSGTPISATGRTNFYSGFDLNATEDLWWSFTQIANPRLSNQSATGNMAFSSFNASTGIATWTSTSNLVIPTFTSGTVSTATKLVAQFQPYTGAGNAPLGSGWLTPTTAGAEGIPGFSSGWTFADVVSNFQVWHQFQTSSGVALGSFYDSLSTSSGVQLVTNSSGGFYYTPIPEPSTYAALIGVAALGMVAIRRRRPVA